jgi:glycosyltransferase involved in cell wall biosynthesis
MAPLRVVHATNELGLGGTAKAAAVHALAHKRSIVEPRVVALLWEGPRRDQLAAAGIPVAGADGDLERLVTLLEGADVVHVHRAGVSESLLPEAARRAGVPVLVETNVFGFHDESPDEAGFACHLLISRMCALRYRRRAGLPGPEFHRRHRVCYYPVDVDGLRARAPEPAEAKRRLGLDPDRPVVGRLGRADDRKWSTTLVDMVPRLLELMPDAQVVLVGTTPAVRRRLGRRGARAKVTQVEPVADDEELATLYAACDVFATGSSIGESFGLAIAEAMALGIPVVTHSTPWVDNAQVELVDEGSTGHIANHPQAFAEAVASLLADEPRRRELAAAAREKCERMFAAAPLTRQLERLYRSLVAGEGIPEWDPPPANVDAFAAEYAARCQAQYRPLTPRERVEARTLVLAERARWAARDLRRQPGALAQAIASRLSPRRRWGAASAPR